MSSGSPGIPHLVSTIIPVYNRPTMLREAVESALAQTYRPIEIIISDDGSTDETPAVAQSLAAAFPDIIRYIHNPNQGAGPAREAGRQLARGEFIQYLDSDDRLCPAKFEVQVRALRDHPECGAAYGFIRLCPEIGPALAHPYKWTGREFSELFPWLLADRWWNTDCPLFRRSVCDRVGPWSDLRYSQDWEYDARVGALNTKLTQCKEFVCEQRQHSGIRQTSKRTLVEKENILVEKRLNFKLFECALQAGVEPGTVVMRHFSRHMFLYARWAGSVGMRTEAKEFFALALEAAGPQRAKGADFRFYTLLVHLLGWQWAGRIAVFADRVGVKGKRRETLPWSWA